MERLLLHNVFLKLILESYTLKYMVSFGPCCLHPVVPAIFLRGFLCKPEKETNYGVFWERPGPINEWEEILLVERGTHYVLQQ